MPATQALLSRGPILRLGTAATAAAPVDGVTLPHYTMSPTTPTGLQTTGLALGLKAPTVSPAATGSAFSIILWILNPVTRAWFAAAAASIAFDEAFISFDFNACALYFQIEAASVSGAGDIDLHLWEQ
jgi:hypothetical protein